MGNGRRSGGAPTRGRKTAGWAAPRPRDLPVWRHEMIAARRSEAAAREHALALGAEYGTARHIIVEDPVAAARRLNRQEAQRLQDADLYYATRDATRLAVSVVDEIAGDALAEHDPPSPSGLIVFAEPIATWVSRNADGSGEPIQIVAASWGPHHGATHQIPRSLPGIWFTLYTPTSLSFEEFAREAGPGADPARLRATRRLLYATNGPLMWDNEIFVPFGADPRPLRLLDTYGWSLVVRAAWMLMDSPGITQSDQAAASRTEIRRERNAAAAAGATSFTAPPAVRVVELRRRQTHGAGQRAEHAGQDGRRIYTCRWTVRGHTRRQRYGPGNTLTKRIYIEPHLQGPQEAPVKAPRPETVRLFDV